MNLDIATAETIPHDFSDRKSRDDHPLNYLFGDMSAPLQNDYTDYVKFEVFQEHKNIHWMHHDSPEEVLQFISKKLSDSSVREAKFGITTSPHWRMTKTSSIPAENESECTMEPHEKSWGSMFVLYTHWGQDVGDLEVAAIANFRSNPKVKNLNPGKEGYSHDHPSFFYMVGNSLQDIVRFASLRKRNAGHSVCFA